MQHLKTSETIINILSNLFRTVGYPQRILTDQGTNFTSNKLKHFLNNQPQKIIHLFTTSYHPQCNGLNEKANDIIISKLRSALLAKPTRKWSTLLSEILHNYNNQIHGSTGFPPQFLLNGTIDSHDNNILATISLEEARNQAKQKSDQLKLKWKQRYDEKHKPLNLKVGDLVKRKIPVNRPDIDKLTPKYEGPFTVIKVRSDVNYEVNQPCRNTPTTTVHVSQLEPYFNRPPRLNLSAGE